MDRKGDHLDEAERKAREKCHQEMDEREAPRDGRYVPHPEDVNGAVRAPLLDSQRRLVPKACVLRHGPENFFPLLASFIFFGSSRFTTPHRPGGTGVIEGAVITGLGAGVVE